MTSSNQFVQGIRDVSIDEFVSASIIRDLKAAQTLIPPKSSARLYRIPVEEFNKAIEKIVRINPYMAFRPTLLGLPVDMGTRAVPEMVVVHDDDTNAAQSTVREDGVD